MDASNKFPKRLAFGQQFATNGEPWPNQGRTQLLLPNMWPNVAHCGSNSGQCWRKPPRSTGVAQQIGRRRAKLGRAWPGSIRCSVISTDLGPNLGRTKLHHQTMACGGCARYNGSAFWPRGPCRRICMKQRWSRHLRTSRSARISFRHETVVDQLPTPHYLEHCVETHSFTLMCTTHMAVVSDACNLGRSRIQETASGKDAKVFTPIVGQGGAAECLRFTQGACTRATRTHACTAWRLPGQVQAKLPQVQLWPTSNSPRVSPMLGSLGPTWANFGQISTIPTKFWRERQLRTRS